MTPTRCLRLAAALAAALLMAGCTQTSAGTPMPDNNAPTTTEPDTTDPTASTKPTSQRPRKINLTDKNPCAIPQSDWPKFDIEQPGKPDEHPDFKSPDCYYSGVGNVTLVVTAGIEIWTEDRYDAEIKDAAPIDGFPALTVASEVVRQTCLAIVDVADGQFLMTTASPNPNDPSSPEKCDLAYQLAESAMKTLAAS